MPMIGKDVIDSNPDSSLGFGKVNGKVDLPLCSSFDGDNRRS